VAKGKRKTKSKLPTATKKKILANNHTKPTSKAAGNLFAKASNFSAEEDNMLAKAYVNISTNPIHGSGMKSNDFWENVRQKWKELLKTEGTGVFTSRTSSALKLRFQRRIQKDMNLRNACYKRVRNENQSGLNNVASIHKKTGALFESINKKPFRFAGCVEFLQQMLKFQPMEKPDVDDGSEFAPAMDDEPPDDNLDADFDDGSDDEKKPASKPSSKSASKVAVNNQEARTGSALKRPPGRSKTKSAKAAGIAANKQYSCIQ
jgi:hypothetical protein